MNFEHKLIGTIEGKTANDYCINCLNGDSNIVEILKMYSMLDGKVAYDNIVNAENAYETLDLSHGVRVVFGIYTNETGRARVEILERLRIYEKRILEEYFDILVKRGLENHMIPELLAEANQKSIDFGDKEEISPDEIKNYVSDTDVFVDNPNYQSEANNINVYDSRGRIIFSIESNQMSGIKFVFPFQDEEQKQAFFDFCDMIMKTPQVNYPKSEE